MVKRTDKTFGSEQERLDAAGENSFGVERSGNQAFAANMIEHQKRRRYAMFGGAASAYRQDDKEKNSWRRFAEILRNSTVTPIADTIKAVWNNSFVRMATAAKVVEEVVENAGEHLKSVFTRATDSFEKWATQVKNSIGRRCASLNRQCESLSNDFRDASIEGYFKMSFGLASAVSTVQNGSEALSDKMTMAYIKASQIIGDMLSAKAENNTTADAGNDFEAAVEKAHLSLADSHQTALALPSPQVEREIERPTFKLPALPAPAFSAPVAAV